MTKNNNGETMVEHHVKYEELHGVDETIWITNGAHQQLHHRLRKERKCNVPVEELHKISTAAHMRTEKHKLYLKRYEADIRDKEKRKEYRKSNKMKQYYKEYMSSNYFQKSYIDTVDLNIQHQTQILINLSTDHLKVSCSFRGNNGRKITWVDID